MVKIKKYERHLVEFHNYENNIKKTYMNIYQLETCFNINLSKSY